MPRGTLLLTVTVQITLAPPAVTIPLHWLIDATSWVEDVEMVTGRVLRGQEG